MSTASNQHPLTWYRLVDRQGNQYNKDLGPGFLSIPPYFVVGQLHEAVVANTPSLAGIDIKLLKAYRNMEAFRHGSPLDPDTPVEGLGTKSASEYAIVVVVPDIVHQSSGPISLHAGRQVLPSLPFASGNFGKFENSLTLAPIGQIASGSAKRPFSPLENDDISSGESEISFPDLHRFFKLNGINPKLPHFPRGRLLEKLLNLIQRNEFAILSSPAASGKTSLLCLLMEKCRANYNISYITCNSEKSLSQLLLQVGIDTDSISYNHPSKGDRFRRHLVIIDDAQEKYSEMITWAQLLKAIPVCLHDCSIVISAVHSLKTGSHSPAGFASIPKLVRDDFLLSENESIEFLSNTDYGLDQALQSYDDLKRLIARECGGLIGALTVCQATLSSKIPREKIPSQEDVIHFYLSQGFMWDMDRCFGSGPFRSMNGEFIEFLKRCFIREKITVQQMEDKDEKCFTDLVKSGILVNRNGIAEFSSNIARRYYFSTLFPDRASANPNTLVDLIKAAILFFPHQILISSAIGGSFLKEAVFQHLLLNALSKCTTVNTAIHLELSRSFFTSAPIQGEIDFFINGELYWVLEVLVNGNAIGEHIARFEPNGKYARLACKDYCVLDFRQTKSGNVTNISRHEKRITVIFKSGDYSQCWFIAGKSNPEKLSLRN